MESIRDERADELIQELFQKQETQPLITIVCAGRECSVRTYSILERTCYPCLLSAEQF